MSGNAFSKILPVVGAVVGTIWGGQTSLGWQAGAAAGAALGGAAGQAVAEPPEAPKMPEPVKMPSQQEMEDARRKSLLQQFARRGRAATNLTGQMQQSGSLSGL